MDLWPIWMGTFAADGQLPVTVFCDARGCDDVYEAAGEQQAPADRLNDIMEHHTGGEEEWL